MSTFTPQSPPPPVTPLPPEALNFAWLCQHPARLLAFGGGSGLSPIAPGTCGTLAIWPVFIAAQGWFSPWMWLVILTLGFVLGIWACAKTGTALGVPDHSGMVWDEMIAFCWVLLLLPPGLGWQVAGFAAFRFFDIVKPPPIAYFDRTYKGGFGVMWDDLVAAFYALLLLALYKHAMSTF